MSNIGKLIRECRKDAKPTKIAQKQVADVLQKDTSYISKVEKGEIEPDLSGAEVEELARLFRENQVSDIKIREFVQACDAIRISGGMTLDKDSDILKIIYTTLQELDESEKQAYRKELSDRNDVWHGFRQVMVRFRSNQISFGEVDETFQRLELIEENSVSNLRARMQLESSRILRYQGKIRPATTKFSHALELAQKSGDDILWAEALKERGDFFRRSKQENLRSALKDYEKVYEVYENRYNELGKANAQIRIASVLLTSGLLKYNNHDAIKLCEEGLKSARIRRNSYLERKSLEYLAWARSMEGYYEKSLETQQLAHEIAVSTNGEPKELAKSSTYMAGFYLNCGLFDLAEKWYNEANSYVKLMFSNRNEVGEEKEIFIRALIYLGLGTLKIQRPTERIEARSYLNQSLDYADQSNDSLTLGRVLTQMAQLDMIEGSLLLAKEKFEIAKHSFEKSGLDSLGNPYYLSNLKFGLTELEYRMKNYPGAKSILNEINEFASKFGYHEQQIKYKLWCAMLLADEDLKTNEEEIIELCLSALNSAAAVDIHVLSNSLNTITSYIERLYRDDLHNQIVVVVKKLIKQARLIVTSKQDKASVLIINWTDSLQAYASERSVVSKTLKK